MKRITFSCSGIAIALMAATPAFAEWRPLDQPPTQFVDDATFRSSGRTATIWALENLKQPTEFATGTAKSKLTYLEADCQQYQIRTLAYNYHADLLGQGKELDSLNPGYGSKSARWRYVAPNSLDQEVFNRLCLKPKLKVEPPASPATEIEPIASPKTETNI